MPDEILRFGVQFADGRKATTLGGEGLWDFDEENEDREPEGPVLLQQGGGGGGHYEQEFWLWPLPPPGPFAFVIEWPREQVQLTREEVDASVFHDAARESEILWPEQEASPSSSSRQYVIGSVSAQGELVPDEAESDDPDLDEDPEDPPES